MDIAFLSVLGVVVGAIVSLIASVLVNLFSDRILIRKSKIKIGDTEIQLSGSSEESTRKILEKVQELQESPQVFISYSFQDKAFALRLATDCLEDPWHWS